MTNQTLAKVQKQVMWNRLISVVEEQAVTLIRTAFCPSVREAGDLSAGVFDIGGHMIAQAVTGTPGHVNTMAESVAHFIKEFGPDNLLEGDVYITNDPWKGTGHLHDITIVTPTFRNGKLIGFFACTAHVVDIGGRGFGPDSRELYEEGLFIPLLKLFDQGTANSVLLNILRNNVREADQVIGDIFSLSSCNAVGARRLLDMMDEFELDDLQDLAEFIFSNSAKATADRLAELPEGASASNSMTLDGYDEPVTLNVTLTVENGAIIADFVGTSPISKFGINVPLIYTKAYACYGLKCALAPEIPNNEASLAAFQVKAPANCILNAQRPAPVSVRHVLGHFVPDLVLGALHKLTGIDVPAEGSGCLWNLHVSARPTAPDADPALNAEILMFNSGGTGARSKFDGLSSTAFPSGVHTMPVEASEHVGPITIWRKELRPGSGGAGQHRGGLGQIIEIAPNPGFEFRFNAMFDRVDHPANGRDGGLPGAAGRVSLADGTPLKAKGTQRVPEGSALVLELPGGGGHGAPQSRDPEEIKRDVEFGYITEAQACELYGYSFNAR
ncbi:hydantoinase B/oxoprolinase family protein [Klebsiella variicola]|uniref:hydantoinase B/oxoprolinase family protein n=1 Tax=Klebsiella variicola TaxID=244366 RepID=UPI0023A96336|nr:hydantoinase B/oxoprolinase family protein [Klebsiella variicola]MDD9601315.1 hydantoinase B/oxoprolinase family protein [Klebsiella variicola]